MFLILQPLPETIALVTDIAAEYVTYLVSLFCVVVCEWDENDPKPRSFVHVACSCTYMFAISVRDVVAHLNAAVHKFSAGVCSSQNLRVLHVFF